MQKGIQPWLIDNHLPVLVNRAAGKSRPGQIDALATALRNASIDADIHVVEPENLKAALGNRLKQGQPAIAVAGGDGSISSAADVLAGSETALVPLPFGTRNHFAKRCGIASLAAVPRALHQGTVTPVSTGQVNGDNFVNNAACGFYPQMVRYREKLRPMISLWPATIVAALIVASRWQLLDLELDVGMMVVRQRTVALWIGIGRHSLRIPEPGNAIREGDLLEIVLPKPRGRLALVLLATRLLLRLARHQQPDDLQLETLRTTSFTLRSEKPIHLATDGELQLLRGPLTFHYRKAALRVLCLAPCRQLDYGAS